MAEPQLYLCKNTTNCDLGTPGEYGRFTGGRTAEATFMLTGKPIAEQVEGVDYGEGLCPRCVTKGEKWSKTKDLEGKIAEAEAQHKERLAKIRKGEG